LPLLYALAKRDHYFMHLKPNFYNILTLKLFWISCGGLCIIDLPIIPYIMYNLWTHLFTIQCMIYFSFLLLFDGRKKNYFFIII